MQPDYHSPQLPGVARGTGWIWFVLLLIVANITQGTTCGNAVAQGAGSQTPGSRQALPRLQLVQELARPAGTPSVAWSSDGTKLAAYSTSSSGGIFTGGSISGKLITVWNRDGQVFREIQHSEAFFFYDDPLAFVAGDKEVATTPWLKSNTLAFLVFDVESGAVVREVEGPRPNGDLRQDNAATAFVASPDQSILAVAFTFGQPVILYSTRDWSRLASLADSAENRVLAFSPDGAFLAVGGFRGKVLIYDLASKELTLTIDAFPDLGVIRTMAFSPDGTLIAVGTAAMPAIVVRRGEEKEISIRDPVRAFRATDGSRVASFPDPIHPIYSLAWSPDGRVLAFITGYGTSTLHLWDPFQREKSERTIKLTGFATSLAFSPDGTRLAVCHGNKVAIYSIAP
jgi:WD40 repeat protein